jgi:hypothetical protein
MTDSTALWRSSAAILPVVNTALFWGVVLIGDPPLHGAPAVVAVLAIEYVALYRLRRDHLRASIGLVVAAALSVLLIVASFLAVAFGIWDCGEGTGCWG